MNRLVRNFGLCALAISMLTSCFSYNEDILVGESASASATKIINSSRSATAGKLLIKFNERATLAFESAKSSDITRSNIVELNLALNDIHATSIERLFPIDERHEERTRKAGLHRWYVLSFDKEVELEKAAKALAHISDVETVQYNSILSREPSKAVLADVDATTRLAVEAVNDPGFKDQWHYYNTGSGIHEKQVAGMDINVKDAWQYCTGDPSIVVAVIDEGVDYTHEDLKDNMWVNKGEIANNGIDDDGNGYIDDVHGYNHCTGGQVSWDDDHGTHVAGTVAAVNNNRKGVCGVAGGDGSGNGVKIMSSQLMSGSIKGDSEISARAFKYAADNGAVIAQCSWGYDADAGGISNDANYKRVAGVEYDGILYFQSVKNSDVLDGGLVIFASGNDDYDQSGYPAGYRDFISVAATGCDGMPAYYTNYGPGVNISAPGGNMKDHGDKGGVLSTLTNNKYGYMQGTSMACPHVSGVAALGLSYAKKLGKKFSLEEFTAKLLLSVDDIDADLKADPKFSVARPDKRAYPGNMGSGRIDALKMLMNVEGTPCISIKKGEFSRIDLSDYIGDSSLDIKYKDNLNSSTIMSREDMDKLGVTNEPRISGGKLIVTCNKTGHGFINVECIIGGSEAGSDNKMGGRVTTKKIALIVRDGHTTNGGWM